MKKIAFELKGEAEALYEELKNEGMSNASIFGKSLYCLKMVKEGKFIKKVEQRHSDPTSFSEEDEEITEDEFEKLLDELHDGEEGKDKGEAS